MSYNLNELLAIYVGTNGAATKALYEEMERQGRVGQIATHLFRAHKNSGRAKEYRGSGKRAAYATKDWSISSLTALLTKSGMELGLAWGWGVDPKQEFHRDVFYIDLPTGQVSFHAAYRGEGPSYPGQWDGIRDQGATRICKWILSAVLGEVPECDCQCPEPETGAALVSETCSLHNHPHEAAMNARLLGLEGEESMDNQDIPRRIRVDQMTAAELAIREAVLAVEKAGAHPLLTEAVVLLGQAQEKVADFVDGQPIEQEIIALAQKHKVVLTAEVVRSMAAVFSTARWLTNG